MNAFIESLNSFSAAWASAMLRAAWQGALVILAVWALCRIPSIPAQARCWLWRLAFLKLFLAVVWVSPLLELPLLSADPVAEVPARVPMVVEATIDAAPIAAVDADPGVTYETPANDPVAAAPVRPNAATVVLGIWALAVVVMAGLVLRGALAVHRLRHSSSTVSDGELIEACAELSRHYGLSRPPPLATASGIPSALLLGIGRPLILLPAHALNAEQMGEARLMLAHELAHLKRRDLLWNWLATLANALFFFHPLVWVARREYRLAQESACDAAALRATGARPSEYGAMVLSAVATASSFARRRHVDRAAPALAVGIVSSSCKRNLQRRLIAMSTIRPTSRRNGILCAFMVALVAGIALVPWRIVAQEATAGGAAKAPDHRAAEPAADRLAGTEARIFSLKYSQAHEMSGHILRLYRGDPKNPTGVQVSADERTNSLIIVAPIATMKEIDQLLQKLDAPAGEAGVDPNGNPAAGRGVPGEVRRGERNGEPVQPEGMRVMGRLFADVVTLRAPADGLVLPAVPDGAAVKKGEVIIRLDDRRAKAALMAAEAQYKLADAQLRRINAIRRSNDVSESEVQQAEAELQVTAANMELRREDLNELVIIAPRSGMISDLKVHEGERVQKGSELARLVASDALKVGFHVPPHQVSSLKVGQKVQVTSSPPQGERAHEAEIYFIDPTVEAATGTIEVRARLKSPDAALRSGAMVNIYLPSTERGN